MSGASVVSNCRDVSQVIDFSPTALTPDQSQGIELLLMGNSVTQVARKVGVDRRTIQRWRSSNPNFQAEYHRRMLEAMECSEQRLRRLSEKAVSVIERHLDENNLTAATSLLKIVHNMPKATDTETNPQVILKRQTEKMMMSFWHAEPFQKERIGQAMESKTFCGLTKDVFTHLARKYNLENGQVDEIMDEIQKQED